jgi:ABC-2 family transporter protein
MREVMKIMGLNQTAHQLSWLFTAFIVFFWMSVSSTFIAHISFLPYTNLWILFVYFFLFHMSEITLCMLISVFFSNSKLAAIVGPVVLFVTILPKYIFFGSNSNEASTLKTAASLLSPTAFTFGADIIAAYEYSAAGVQYSNIRDNYFSMITVFQMMTIDIFIYGFLAWYLDQTIPHEVGTPKHPLFLFHPFYWFPSLKKVPMCNPQRDLPTTSLPRGKCTVDSLEKTFEE